MRLSNKKKEMDFKIGDKVKLKKSISNLEGEIIGILENDIVYKNYDGDNVTQAKKGEYLVKFSFHKEDSYSFYLKSDLTKYE